MPLLTPHDAQSLYLPRLPQQHVHREEEHDE